MERSEPTFVPQWLKSTGTVAGGGGNSAHHLASDVGRQRNYRNTSDFDSPRHAFLDRTSSLNSRRSSINEMPAAVGSSSTGSMTAPLTASTSGSGGPSVSVGLNMAEALAQAPSRTRTAPQLSVKTQRLEELAIKQSKQLIPVTPSMPKGSVLNSVDKSKAKPAVRASEMSIAIKGGQQQPSSIHHGWENGISSPTQKDVATPITNVNSKVTSSQHAVAAVTSAPARNSNNPKHSAGERKAAALNPIAGFTVEKRPSLAQTQSRNDFFNHLKKKTSTNTSPDEEEAAFLRSLGWEENSGDDEGLTEEEINAFYQRYSVQPKLAQSIATNLDGASSELSSSDSGSEA
ncbi:hypothetical protein V6N12_028420 [Hibiscus sabdariffa]|uniref:Uncharacterized protein n=1 Tax=Hibiscus sabdariffa TaxID=183260 RepID=A0ABR2F5S6_9ROSI